MNPEIETLKNEIEDFHAEYVNHQHLGEDDVRVNFSDLDGNIQVVDVVPTETPRDVNEQIKIYVNGADSRLYMYDNIANSWIFTTLPSADALINVVEDTTPQLGGDLDVNGNSIVSVSSGDIAITPNSTGDIVLDGQKWPQADGIANDVLTTDGSGQTSWDKLLYGGSFDSAGDELTPFPTGWLSIKISTGRYRVTHGFGSTNYTVVAMATDDSDYFVNLDSKATNSFVLDTYDSAGTLTDIGAEFIVFKG